MRYSKKRKSGQYTGVWTAAGILAAAGLLIYGMYALGMFSPAGEEATEPVSEGEQIADLADCLTASGARMYGAYWCPHCQSQKAAFGDAVDRITYVECADEETGDQVQVCADAKVASYPTWIFGDGSRLTGERSFWELARKSGCDWGG